MQPNRRGFLGFAGAGLGAAWSAPVFGAGSDAPDLLVLNAKVYTVDGKTPRAQAFAVRAGRFVAVGSSDDMRALAGPRTQTFDAQGATVTPGFIDCHNHAPGETLLYDVLVGNPFEVEFVTIDSIVEKLRARAQTLPPDTWVRGEFFDDIKVKDGRLLNVHDLDKVSTTQPVGVRHRGGHTMFYNSRAFAMAGITKATPNPPGGTYDKGPDGELNGRVTDLASAPIERIGLRQTFSPEEAARRGRDGQAHMSKQFVRYGLTSVHHEGGDLSALQDVRARGDLKHRVSYEPQALVMEAMIRSGLQTGFGDEWIKLGATSEHLVDGSFSERTMAMSHPYAGVSPPYFGNLTETPEVLNAWIERVHRAGIDVNCHANGDVAIDRVLTAVERAQKLYPRPGARPKITHCTLLNPSLIARIKAAGVVPAVFSTYAYYNSDKFPFYGEATIRQAMCFRDLLDAGVPVCAGSDFNPGPFSPLMAMQAMVTRKGWDGKTWGANQKITVDEALRVNTLNGAYASHEEGLKGSITPGKLADYVILADDPHTVDPDKIKDIKILRTVTGGTVMYQA
ncbi:amidohydrolase [Phenylobacterium sp.]|uniref:amidohydrolase n=1 Tax=Phenylobacterium sp. TaxID=1871053 RepID=UPI002B593207|nr:amidohydrolase [Phenylobacterium sp.]HLZ76969.1 amidohydrolase [Phenylobacterium sp.]